MSRERSGTSALKIELSSNGKIVDASITLSDFANLPSKHAFEQLESRCRNGR